MNRWTQTQAVVSKHPRSQDDEFGYIATSKAIPSHEAKRLVPQCYVDHRTLPQTFMKAKAFPIPGNQTERRHEKRVQNVGQYLLMRFESVEDSLAW